MSGLYKKRSTTTDELAGIQLQTSAYGGALPLCYGTTRISANMVDYDDFTTYSHTQSSGKGGGSSSTSYTYSAGAILAICEGPVASINRVWSNQSVNTVAYYDLTIFNGTRPQTPWSVWASKHAGKAVGYSGIALACNDDFDLGDQGTMANWSFETTALLATESDNSSHITIGTGNGTQTNFELLDINGNGISDSTTPPMSGYVGYQFFINGVVQSSGVSVGKIGNVYYAEFSSPPANGSTVAWSTTLVVNDAKPAAILVDFLTDPTHGAGWNTAWIGNLNSGANSFQTYCTAQGFAVSPCWDAQQNASESIKDLLTATNSEAVWTAGQTGCQLNVVPYGDTPLTANGVTFTPLTSPLYSFTYDDFLGVVDSDGKLTGDDPVSLTRTAIADVYNTWPVEFWDRQNAYNSSTVQDPEPVNVAQYGQKVASGTQLHMITRRTHALSISRILANRSVYLRNQYTFKVGWKYMLLEPMDLVSITDTKLGISNLIVRIISVDFPAKKDEDEGFTIVAESWPFGVGTSTVYSSQTVAAPVTVTSADPGPVVNPVIFDVPVQYSDSGGPEIIIAAAGGAQWGGSNVWVSGDGSTYALLGTITAPCRYGVTNMAWGTSGTGGVDLTHSMGSLASASTSVANDLQTLCWIGQGSSGSGGELVGFSTATLTSQYEYTLTLPIRGAYATTIETHASGSNFVRLDGDVLRYQVPASNLGSVFYIKFTSFNLWGGGTELLQNVSAYTYTPTSQGVYANQNGTNGGGNNSTTTILQNSASALTNSDKISLIAQWSAELAIQGSNTIVGSLDYTANQYGLSHSSYDSAIMALSSGLIALGAPSNWATLWPDGTTFIAANVCTDLAGWWATINADRTALQASISGYLGSLASAAAALTPSIVASLPSLPNASYPAGKLVMLSTTSQLWQVNTAGTTWVTPIVYAAQVSGTLPAAQIGAGLTASQIASVNAAAVGAGLTGSQIAANTITGGNIVAGSITGGNIAAGAITASLIAANTITAGQIAANCITATQIQAGSISTACLAAGVITAAQLQATLILSTVIQSSNYVAGTYATPPSGFKLSGNPFTSYFLTGQADSNCILEIGGDVNFGGWQVQEVVNGLYLNLIEYNGQITSYGTPASSAVAVINAVHTLGNNQFITMGTTVTVLNDLSGSTKAVLGFIPLTCSMTGYYQIPTNGGSNTTAFTFVWPANYPVEIINTAAAKGYGVSPVAAQYYYLTAGTYYICVPLGEMITTTTGGGYGVIGSHDGNPIYGNIPITSTTSYTPISPLYIDIVFQFMGT